MSDYVVLNNEHRDFQPGETPLNPQILKLDEKPVQQQGCQWLFYAALVLPLLMLVVGATVVFPVVMFMQEWNWRSQHQPITATVLSCDSRQEPGLEYRVPPSPRVEYEYTVNGTKYQDTHLVKGTTCNALTRGSPLTVYYLANAPQKSRVDPHSLGWAVVGVCFMLFVFIGGTMMVYYPYIIKPIWVRLMNSLYVYSRLQQGGHLLDATVISVERQRGGEVTIYHPVSYYRQRQYQITVQLNTHDGQQQYTQAIFASVIDNVPEVGDTVQVLYANRFAKTLL